MVQRGGGMGAGGKRGPRPRLSDEQRDEIARRLDEGETAKAVSQSLGIGYGTVATVNKARRLASSDPAVGKGSSDHARLIKLATEVGLMMFNNVEVPADMISEGRTAMAAFLEESARKSLAALKRAAGIAV